MVAARSLPVAPAEYIGTQPGFGSVPDFRLYNLTESIPGHPVGSTVSDDTLRRAGYVLPEFGPASENGAGCGLDVPAPLPTVANCPQSNVYREVVPHPSGGYTHAQPCDATRSTVREYRGWWSTRRAARAALDLIF